MTNEEWRKMMDRFPSPTAIWSACERAHNALPWWKRLLLDWFGLFRAEREKLYLAIRLQQIRSGGR